MRVTELALRGAYLVELEPIADERGEFVRLWSTEDFIEHGLNMRIEHVSVAGNRRKGTLRGMHYQVHPHAETKIVRCVAGAVFDVIVDLRPDSPTYLLHECVEMTHQRPCALWIPKGCAHGYQTLADETYVEYFIDAPYKPDFARGVRYDDALLGIQWPSSVTSISDRDRGFAALSQDADSARFALCASQS